MVLAVIVNIVNLDSETMLTVKDLWLMKKFITTIVKQEQVCFNYLLFKFADLTMAWFIIAEWAGSNY